MTDYPLTVSITGGPTPSSIKVTGQDGEPIKGIRAISFNAAVNEIPSATLDIISPTLSLWEINACVPLDQLVTIAKAHGYLLVPDEPSHVQLNYDTLRQLARMHGYDLVNAVGFHEEP
jgi:seryl-tRNA(Sec) selenium transferase